jgi:hypothetical protein
MNTLLSIVLGLFVQTAGQWTTLFDGSSGLAAFNMVGDANWKLVDGVVQADNGVGFLVTKSSYGDFQLKAEFWVDDDANSGIFIRCSDPQTVNANTSYEVNIFDKRPGQEYRTGAVVNFASPKSNISTVGKWNTIEITAQGPRLIVAINGIPMADVENGKWARGPIALQRSAGLVKFRIVQIRAM